jgi:hypothetical protein
MARGPCGRFEGPDCNDLLELGTDPVARGRPDIPLIVAVDGACPPNARCMPSLLGGEDVAVVVAGRTERSIGP